MNGATSNMTVKRISCLRLLLEALKSEIQNFAVIALVYATITAKLSILDKVGSYSARCFKFARFVSDHDSSSKIVTAVINTFFSNFLIETKINVLQYLLV